MVAGPRLGHRPARIATASRARAIHMVHSAPLKTPSLAAVLPTPASMALTPRADHVAPTAGNRRLSTLPLEVRTRLHGALHRVPLACGELLAPSGAVPRYAYFPVQGVIALVASTPDGQSAQVGLVTADSAVALPGSIPTSGLPFSLVAPVPGEALRIRVESLAQALAGTAVREALVLEVAHHQMLQSVQAAVCHRFHAVPARLATWLLTVSTALETSHLHVTQDVLEQLLGSPRSVVSAAAARFQQLDLIRVRHGRVRIVQRGGLVAGACACYPAVGDSSLARRVR